MNEYVYIRIDPEYMELADEADGVYFPGDRAIFLKNYNKEVLLHELCHHLYNIGYRPLLEYIVDSYSYDRRDNFRYLVNRSDDVFKGYEPHTWYEEFIAYSIETEWKEHGDIVIKGYHPLLDAFIQGELIIEVPSSILKDDNYKILKGHQ